MSSATTFAKAFNNQLYNLIKSLSDRFPNIKELKLALTGIETLKRFNPKKSIDFFILHGYKFRNLIMEKNEEAFKNINYESDISTLMSTAEFEKTISHYNINTSEYKDVDIMDVISKFWHNFDNDERENIWKYLQVLMELCDKYIAESFNKK
jgi:hypothetical protein